MNGIFTLVITCVGGRYLDHPYQFVLDVSVESMLGDLAGAILGILDFEDDDHLDTFYLANSVRGHPSSLTADGEFGEGGADVMDLRLCEVFPLPKNKKLYYLFDFGASWCFQITKQGKQKAALASTEYPCIVSETGTKPKEFGDDEDLD